MPLHRADLAASEKRSPCRPGTLNALNHVYWISRLDPDSLARLVLCRGLCLPSAIRSINVENLPRSIKPQCMPAVAPCPSTVVLIAVLDPG